MSARLIWGESKFQKSGWVNCVGRDGQSTLLTKLIYLFEMLDARLAKLCFHIGNLGRPQRS